MWHVFQLAIFGQRLGELILFVDDFALAFLALV